MTTKKDHSNRVKNSLNAENFEKNYRENIGPSMTVPDQTMSIRTILERHSRGMPIPPGRQELYEGDESSGLELNTMDLTEKQELYERSQEVIAEAKKRKQDKEVEKQNKTTRILQDRIKSLEKQAVTAAPDLDPKKDLENPSI